MCKGLAALPATCLKSAKDIKHKIGFLLQKPEAPHGDEKKTVKTKAAAAAEKRVPPAADVEKWKTSFSHLLSSESGRVVFTKFLRSEFSEENVEFWKVCQEYKKTPCDNMKERARQIYQQYVAVEAPNEVNLDAATREGTRRNLENAEPSCFDEAQSKIYTLMEKDSYRRFLGSKLIQDLSPLTCTCATAPERKKRHFVDKREALLTAGA